jgi:hypothetical protein
MDCACDVGALCLRGSQYLLQGFMLWLHEEPWAADGYGPRPCLYSTTTSSPRFRLFIVEISENGGKLHLLSCRQIWHFLIPPVRILSQPLTGGLSRRGMGYETLGRVITPAILFGSAAKAGSIRLL